ncbi:PucR family transcriptional regulator [Nocardia stercoris]|uniref:PucR family transcriptional regulator n=1 Tax=Nocardia stercoris TaxID=2483361 RepID=A0A3M2L0T0_9NOCA|nr:helix-turn-helix domain-containing protein [Nocardia stercoris]RMI30103.1 PucR family transcriptional regulator [Nocardia stercoris]
MTVEGPPRAGLSVSGTPMSTPLKDVGTLAGQMVGHFVETVVACGTLPGDAIHGDVTTITRTCLELAVSLLDGRDVPEQTRRLEVAAAQWAREGIPIDTIHHAIHEGFKIGLDLVTTGPLSRPGPPGGEEAMGVTVADFASLADGAKLVIELLDRMTTAVSMAYLRELRAVVSEHHTAVHTLTSALLGGHSTSIMARECGIEIAESYYVLAVALPPHPDESDPRVDARVVARRKLRRVQAELATRQTEKVLSLLSVDGGTILVPADAVDVDELEELTEQLSQAAGVPITAAMVSATPENIPAASEHAHELLDMLQRLRLVHGLFRFDDLALEYQLTRPGPGRDQLGAVLDPLDEYPELLQTLETHISNDLNRKRTARVLHVHMNTVDYRLKRVAQLTGLDPGQASGLWYLRSALIARTYRSR